MLSKEHAANNEQIEEEGRGFQGDQRSIKTKAEKGARQGNPGISEDLWHEGDQTQKQDYHKQTEEENHKQTDEENQEGEKINI